MLPTVPFLLQAKRWTTSSTISFHVMTFRQEVYQGQILVSREAVTQEHNVPAIKALPCLLHCQSAQIAGIWLIGKMTLYIL